MFETIANWFASNRQLFNIMMDGLWETIILTFWSTLFGYLLGTPLGVLLVVTDKGGIKENAPVNQIMGTIVNVLRSVPFLILIVMLFPLTRIVMGTTLGVKAAIFPLVICAFPYIARMVESSLKEVDAGVIEAAQSMGATPMQIVFKVILPEAIPSLINGAAICMTTILAYTAMASAAAGGGLGSVAITYGLNQQRYDIMYAASIMLVVLVQIITVTGTVLTRKKDHRLR